MEGAEFSSARSAWLWVSAFMEGVQRTGKIERTGQVESVEFQKSVVLRRGGDSACSALPTLRAPVVVVEESLRPLKGAEDAERAQ